MQVETTPVNRPSKLLDLFRIKHYSFQTEKLYIKWIRRFILFISKRHLKDLWAKEVEAIFTL